MYNIEYTGLPTIGSPGTQNAECKRKKNAYLQAEGIAPGWIIS